METVAWIFNSDFEKKLFEKQKTKIQSTKTTQEFEYFIHLLEPDKTIYSSKSYSAEFRSRVEGFTKKEFKTTMTCTEIKSWCNSYENPDLLKKLQNKENTIKFLLKNKLVHGDISFVNSIDEIEEGYLYKYSKSLSGGGHLLFPRDKKKIIFYLESGEVLIKERINLRELDFSTLIDKGEIVCCYENIIDKHFQYKGTIISTEFLIPGRFSDEYDLALKKMMSYTSDYKGIHSIDSYIYQAGGESKLFAACEINARKTMGYMAFQFKKKYFPSVAFFKLLLRQNKKKNTDFVNLEQVFSGRVILLSPLDNIFLVFIILAPSKEALYQREKLLDFTFFKNF